MCADIHLLRLYVGQIFFECVLKTSTRRPCPAEHFMHRTGEKRNFIWINFSPHPLVSARRGEVAARSTLALISHRQCRICSNETKLGRMSRKSLSPPVAQSAVPWSITSAGLCQHVVLPTKHNIPLLAFFFFFLSEYHSCTCFLSKMGHERTNYSEIYLGCCTHSKIAVPDVSEHAPMLNCG